jgi:hypothetical protein
VASTGADLEAKLDGWLSAGKVHQLVNKARPMGREQVTDGKTRWIDDKMGEGPSRWFPDVATELGAALHRMIRQSLDRIIPRYQSAAVATAIAAEQQAAASLVEPPRPQPSDIVPSAPIDVATIAALCSRAHIDLAAYRTAYPKETGKLGTLRPVTVSWEPPKNGSYWARVTSPADPTPEEVANTLFGSPLRTSELVVVASPLFGFDSAGGAVAQAPGRAARHGRRPHQERRRHQGSGEWTARRRDRADPGQSDRQQSRDQGRRAAYARREPRDHPSD